jgi:hypothetical protein
MKFLLTVILTIYNLCIIGGTAYLVEVHKWSPFWFVATIIFLMTIDLVERR